MEEGKCQKDFPKPFSDRTTIPGDGFVKYRRRSPASGGRSFMKPGRPGKDPVLIDNTWVVPYVSGVF